MVGHRKRLVLILRYAFQRSAGPGTMQRLKLLPLETGKMDHTVGWERVRRLPSYRAKDSYAFEISVRAPVFCYNTNFVV